jgi:germacradienol/geosmin synthase
MLDGVVWSQRRWEDMKLTLRTALIHPDLPARELDLVNRWYVWALYCDDALVEAFKRRRPLGSHDLVAARLMASRLRLLMPVEPGAPVAAPRGAIERGLASLWSELPPELPAAAREEIAEMVVAPVANVNSWEIANLHHRRVPETIDYVEQRRIGSRGLFVAQFPRLLGGPARGLPAEVLDARPLRELGAAVADWRGLHNDLVSLEREASYEGDANTIVRSLGRLLGCGRNEAIGLTVRLLNARMHQIEAILASQLGPLAGEFELDADGRERIRREVDALTAALAGDYEWYRHTGRYRAGGASAVLRPLPATIVPRTLAPRLQRGAPRALAAT